MFSLTTERLNKYPNNILLLMAESKIPKQEDNSGNIFIDRNPNFAKAIYDLIVRDFDYLYYINMIPQHIKYDVNFRDEFDYYNIKHVCNCDAVFDFTYPKYITHNPSKFKQLTLSSYIDRWYTITVDIIFDFKIIENYEPCSICDAIRESLLNCCDTKKKIKGIKFLFLSCDIDVRPKNIKEIIFNNGYKIIKTTNGYSHNFTAEILSEIFYLENNYLRPNIYKTSFIEKPNKLNMCGTVMFDLF